MNKNKTALLVIVFIVILGFASYLFYFKNTINNPIKVINSFILKDGEHCFAYNHAKTTDEPYDIYESINMNVKGIEVAGNKKGTQNGPDMTNGYIGAITGTINSNTINAIFSYTIEGSKNKEEEIYKIKNDGTGIDKLRYPLIEKNKMLVPDTTKEFKTLLYVKVDCMSLN